MNYNILYENPDESLLERVLKIRNIEEETENFLNPTFSRYWLDPYKLNDFQKAIDRIKHAIINNEKIVIFGDYDVDGITASYLLFSFFKNFLNYKNISIRLPNRLEDGYGIKPYHLDEVKELGASLVITVDNGITATEESKHAKEIGLDLIITDHHKPLDKLPEAFAVINPQVSPEYSFKGIAGVGVAFKLASALSQQLIKDKELKNKALNFLLPIVTIGTIADCVPLVSENRLLVKKGLEIINSNKGAPNSIKNFINYLNIKNPLNTFHIGFMIAPRLNAGGRIMTPYDSLYCLLYNNFEKQKTYLDKIEEINGNRRQIQEDTTKQIAQNIDTSKKVLCGHSKDFHEGVIGIVAGRLTERYNKPSAVFSIDEKKGTATASLRSPEYFSVIDMLYEASSLLERFGGHKQAGGLTVKLENLEKVIEIFEQYGETNIKEEDMKKKVNIDTKIYTKDIQDEELEKVKDLEPFGEGNPEPKFLLEDIIINSGETVGKKGGKSHLKLHINKSGKEFPVMFWGKGGELENIERNTYKNIIGKIKKDTYKGGFFIEGNEIIDQEK